MSEKTVTHSTSSTTQALTGPSFYPRRIHFLQLLTRILLIQPVLKPRSRSYLPSPVCTYLHTSTDNPTVEYPTQVIHPIATYWNNLTERHPSTKQLESAWVGMSTTRCLEPVKPDAYSSIKWRAPFLSAEKKPYQACMVGKLETNVNGCIQPWWIIS